MTSPQFYKNPLPVIVFSLLCFCLFLAPEKVLYDGDTGWHITTGNYIVEHHSIPATNVFSNSAGNYQWMNISWLYDVAIGEVYKFGGLYAVSCAAILLMALIAGLVTYLCVWRSNGAIVATAETMTAGFFSFLVSTCARPHLITYLFTTLTLMICYRFRKSFFPAMLLVPVLFLLWANMHGGFLIGLTILGAFFLELLFAKKWQQALILGACMVASFAASLINPLGTGIFEAINRSLSGPMEHYIKEWKTPTDPLFMIYVLLFLISLGLRFRKMSVAEIILGLFWLAESLVAVRNLPIFTIVSAPAVAAALNDLIMNRKNLADKELDYATDFAKPKFRGIVYGIALAMLLIFPSGLWKNFLHFNPEKINLYPAKEVAFALANYPDLKYFNDYDSGGYIVFGSNGKIKTFIDGRSETAFPESVVDDYIKFYNNDKNWPQLLDKYDITGIILNKNEPRQTAWLNASKDWKKVFQGSAASVFIRK